MSTNPESTDPEQSRGSRSIFDGLHDLADALHSVAEEARSFEHTVSFGTGNEGVVRVEVSTDLGESSHTTAGSSSTARSEAAEAQEGRPVRRPVVDVEEDEEAIRVVVEMPGVTEEGLNWAVEGRALSLEAPTERVRYARVVELPIIVAEDEATVTVEAGIVTFTFPREADADDE